MTKTYSIHVVAAGADYAERIDRFAADLSGTTDTELIDQAATIVTERGHVVLRDADGGCCVVDGDEIAITVEPADDDDDYCDED